MRLPETSSCENFEEEFELPDKSQKKKKLQGSLKRRKPRQHPLLKALELQNLLDTGMVNNQAELAERCGISRARVTQYLNLLKLPDEIIDFLRVNSHQESVLRYFTERRLRELTRLKGNERRRKKFRKMIEEIGLKFDGNLEDRSKKMSVES